MDEYTADAWHDLLSDISLDEARAAVVTVARRQPFCAASEIRAEVRRARAHETDQEHLRQLLDPQAHRAQVAAADSAFLRKLAARTGKSVELKAPEPLTGQP
jgi:hypothetical protein